MTYDVAIVGAGVVGTAIARELSARPLDVVLVEAADDIGTGTSKANTAILHTGFDTTPGTLEAVLVRRGFELLSAYAARAGIAVERTGALLVAWTVDELAALHGLVATAVANGYLDARLVPTDELYRLEPRLGPGALGALVVPDESIVCPWTTPLAFATQALAAGAELMLETRVEAIATSSVGPSHEEVHRLETSRGEVTARWVVNAAGLQADTIDRMFGHDDFSVRPRRGQLVVFDKLARPLLRHIVLPVPTARGKGVLVAPTVFGNVLLGPTAEEVEDRADTASTEEGLAVLRRHASRILPELLGEEVTSVYAGVRAATEHSDYQIRCYGEQRYVCVGGIRSTGLTSAMAIAEHVAALMELPGNGPDLDRTPVMPALGEVAPRPYERADLIAADSAYGSVVCHCERVTHGEIRDALRSAIPPHDVDGLRRRTRAVAGRCQGFYCRARVRALMGER